MVSEPDLFISYVRSDDQPLMAGQAGWISNFHKVLAIRLEMLRLLNKRAIEIEKSKIIIQ